MTQSESVVQCIEKLIKLLKKSLLKIIIFYYKLYIK